MSRLPDSLAREIADLGRFELRHTAVADQVILTATVRGVPVEMRLDQDTYPREPPTMAIASGWSWGRRDLQIEGLWSQEHWNRTLGLGTLLRELEKAFIEDPPRRRRQREGGLASRIRALFAWLRELPRKLFGARKPVPAEADLANMPEAIRARYQELIGEKASRIERYKQAVTQLTRQWQRQTAGIEELGREVRQLESAQETTLEEANSIVDRLKAQGQELAEIRQDRHYQRCLAAYESRAVELEESQERFTELEQDAREHLEKIRDHETQLEALTDELEEMEDEFAEVTADLTTVELEKEIVDLRAGISQSESDEELTKLLRRFRKTKASVRITKEIADLDEDAQDAEYLDIAHKVSAARDFERSLGLDDPVERSRRDEDRRFE